VPLKLEFEPLDGFTINEVHGPKVYKSNFKVEGESTKVSAGAYMQFKIRAERNTALGSAHGCGSRCKVQKTDFPYGPLPGWQTFLFVVSIPVLIVHLIPLLLVCTVTGTCPEC
jgi:hypothetical protein